MAIDPSPSPTHPSTRSGGNEDPGGLADEGLVREPHSTTAPLLQEAASLLAAQPLLVLSDSCEGRGFLLTLPSGSVVVAVLV